jgi:hypothetical protein
MVAALTLIGAMTVSRVAEFSALPSRSLSPDSAKTCGNPVRRTARRKTDEFPVPVTAALIGR